jgi:hypothetical protein
MSEKKNVLILKTFQIFTFFPFCFDSTFCPELFSGDSLRRSASTREEEKSQKKKSKKTRFQTFQSFSQHRELLFSSLQIGLILRIGRTKQKEK